MARRMRCLRTLHAMDAIRLCYRIVGIERTLLPAHILIFLLRRNPMLILSQVNNVIIAGSEDNEF